VRVAPNGKKAYASEKGKRRGKKEDRMKKPRVVGDGIVVSVGKNEGIIPGGVGGENKRCFPMQERGGSRKKQWGGGKKTKAFPSERWERARRLKN